MFFVHMYVCFKYQLITVYMLVKMFKLHNSFKYLTSVVFSSICSVSFCRMYLKFFNSFWVCIVFRFFNISCLLSQNKYIILNLWETSKYFVTGTEVFFNVSYITNFKVFIICHVKTTTFF